MNASLKHPITPRENLDFQLDESIPRYWFDNDAFKTRFMESIFVSFPAGERYFMTSVRAFRDRIIDPVLQEEVQAFNRQEAQHGMVHGRFNDLLRQRGLPIDEVERALSRRLDRLTQKASPEFNLAVTAACEHVTALMAEIFYAREDLLHKADYRVRAMLAWHAMEEMEHKSVAFDVLQKVAGVGNGKRALAMLMFSILFVYYRVRDTNQFLQADGISPSERRAMMRKGLWWAFGRKGVFSSMLKPWLAYFRPGFHPWQQAVLPEFDRWMAVYGETGDPIAAAEALFVTGQVSEAVR